MSEGLKKLLKDGETVNLNELTDWELVLITNHYDYKTDIPERHRDKCICMVWGIQDRYGFPGIVPEDGWNWEAIRDSSDESKIIMGKVIRRYLKQNKIITIKIL